MRYYDTIDESRQYLRLCLEQIGKHGLPTDPVNYCVWYEYVSGKNEELNAAIDNHLTNGYNFTGETIHQFFDLHIANGKSKLTALVRNELKKVFEKILGAIKTTNRNLTTTQSNLEMIDDSLSPNLSEGELEKIVAQIKTEIKLLESSNASFKGQIEQANQEIEHLKKKMEHYRSEALKDPLTRIDNRRGFEKKLFDSIDHATTTGASLCLIIADIDHFKKINDTHGHLVGDNVLKMVAATIKESVKGRDLVARVGGEEFAVLLPNTPINGAMKLANDMRISFEGLDLKKRNTGESIGQITLSFGVTIYQPNENLEDFVNRADEALYKSKNTGRNKVTGI